MIIAFFGFIFPVYILLTVATIKDLLQDEEEIKFLKDMLKIMKDL